MNRLVYIAAAGALLVFGAAAQDTEAMAKKKAGDWRDRAQVRTWAAEVAGEVGHP